MQLPEPESMGSIDPVEPAPVEDPPEAEEKINLNTSNDSLNLEAVLDIGPASLNTKDLMNQVMSSDLLMEAIGGEDLVASAMDVETTSDGDSDSGSATESTPTKKREEKRRSARIAHITANDLTIRQVLREREQKMKEKEEKRRQKEEEKRAKEPKESPGSGAETSVASPEIKEVKIELDISSEITKYLQVIDQEIKKTEDGKSPAKEDAVVKEEPKEEKEKGKVRLSLFENLTKKESKDVKGVEELKKEDAEAIGKPSRVKDEEPTMSEKSENNAQEKDGEKLKKEEVKGEIEPGEVEEEEKEVGELSDHEDSQQGGSVYWMDHSYAASSKVSLPEKPVDEAAKDSSSRRQTRRESRKAKEEQQKEDSKEDRPRRSSRRESKAAKQLSNEDVKAAEKGKDDKHHKKKKKKDEKEKKKDEKEKKKHRSRSKSSERESSHSRDRRSKSVEELETDAKKKKKKRKDEKEDAKGRRSSRQSKDEMEEKNKEKRSSRHSKDDKEKGKDKGKHKDESPKRSLKRSRDAKKSKKHGKETNRNSVHKKTMQILYDKYMYK